MPTIYSGDDFVWVGGPGEGFGVLVCFRDEAIDGGLEINEGVENTAFEPPLGEFGEEALDGVEPGGGGGCEVEAEVLVAISQARTLGCLWAA